MIVIDQLRISDNGRLMCLDAHINKASYFDNCHFDSLIIQTVSQLGDNISGNGVEPLTPIDDTQYIYKKEFITSEDPTPREIHLVVPVTAFVFPAKETPAKALYFVYIKGAFKPSETSNCTPCRLDEEWTLAVTFDPYFLYNRIMGYTRELSDTCEVSQGFIDLILNIEAFKAAVETEHFIKAIEIYNRLVDTAIVAMGKGCACK